MRLVRDSATLQVRFHLSSTEEQSTQNPVLLTTNCTTRNSQENQTQDHKHNQTQFQNFSFPQGYQQPQISNFGQMAAHYGGAPCFQPSQYGQASSTNSVANLFGINQSGSQLNSTEFGPNAGSSF